MWLDDLLADSPTTTEGGAVANAGMQRDVPVQPHQSDEPATDVAEPDTMPAAGGSVRISPVRGAVRTESAISGRPHHIAFTVMLPGRDPFRVTCPQGFEAVSAQWPTAIAITPL